MTISRRTRTALTQATDNWLSSLYLAAVTAATGYVLFDALFVDHPDASMAAVVPWLLTAPLSLLYTLLPDGTLSGTSTGVFTALHLARGSPSPPRERRLHGPRRPQAPPAVPRHHQRLKVPPT